MNPSQRGRNSFIKLMMELIRQYQLLHESIPLGMSNTAVLYIAGINSGSTFFFFTVSLRLVAEMVIFHIVELMMLNLPIFWSSVNSH